MLQLTSGCFITSLTAVNFQGRKLLQIWGFVAICESILRKIWGCGIFLWHQRTIRKSFLCKNLFSTNSRKSSPAKVSRFTVFNNLKLKLSLYDCLASLEVCKVTKHSQKTWFTETVECNTVTFTTFVEANQVSAPNDKPCYSIASFPGYANMYTQGEPGIFSYMSMT